MISRIPEEQFKSQYEKQLLIAQEKCSDFDVVSAYRNNTGRHPENYIDVECAFAANNVKQAKLLKILDIGSYRQFILGMLSAYEVATLDVRARSMQVAGETICSGDAKKLPFSDGEFDAVTSLCAIEHFGLGRYGDDFDLEADKIAAKEIRRVLKVGGHFIFSTTIKNGKPILSFNAHRIYSLEMIHNKLVSGMEQVTECFYSQKKRRLCQLAEITNQENTWDLYLGNWRKKR